MMTALRTKRAHDNTSHDHCCCKRTRKPQMPAVCSLPAITIVHLSFCFLHSLHPFYGLIIWKFIWKLFGSHWHLSLWPCKRVTVCERQFKTQMKLPRTVPASSGWIVDFVVFSSPCWPSISTRKKSTQSLLHNSCRLFCSFVIFLLHLQKTS